MMLTALEALVPSGDRTSWPLNDTNEGRRASPISVVHQGGEEQTS